MSKLKTSFYIKNDKIKNEKSAIYVKIVLESTKTTMAMGKSVCPKRWKATNMLLSSKRVDQEISLKNYIYNILDELDKTYLFLRKKTS